MHDLTQTSLATTGEQASKTAIPATVYVPPSLEELNQYAHNVCQQLLSRNSNQVVSTETVQGLTSFVEVIVAIKAKALNPGGEDGKQQ